MNIKFCKNALPIDEDVVIVPYGTTASQNEIENFEKTFFEEGLWDWSLFLSQEDIQTLIAFVSNFVFFNDSTPLVIVGELAFQQLYLEHVGAFPDNLFLTLKNLYPLLPLITSEDPVGGFNCINFVVPIIDSTVFDIVNEVEEVEEAEMYF
jgi:hypothetical protein